MNAFVATGRDGSEAGAVRVQCEAVDCGALLEVEVPANHTSNTPLIVRCGNCQRLLEVWLHMPFGNNEGSEGPLPVAECVTPQTIVSQAPVPVVTAASGGKPAMGPANYHTLGHSYTPQLIRPPPLSRSAFAPNGNGYAQLVAQGHGPMLGSSLNQYSAPAGQSVADNRAAGQRFPGCDGRPGFVTLDGVRHRDLHVQEEEFGSGGKARRVRKMRNPSPYNLFMSEEVKRIKAEQPTVDHKQAFKMAARHWAKSPYDCRKVSSLRSITNRDGPSVTPQSAPLTLASIPSQMEPALGQDPISRTPMLLTAGQIKNKGLPPPDLTSSVLDANGIINLTSEPGASAVPPFLETFLERPPTSAESSVGSAALPEVALPRPYLLESHPPFKTAAALMGVNAELPSSAAEQRLPPIPQIQQTEGQNPQDVQVIGSMGLDLSPTSFLGPSHTAKLEEAHPIE